MDLFIFFIFLFCFSLYIFYFIAADDLSQTCHFMCVRFVVCSMGYFSAHAEGAAERREGSSSPDVTLAIE